MTEPSSVVTARSILATMQSQRAKLIRELAAQNKRLADIDRTIGRAKRIVARSTEERAAAL
jgi:hypothetical protein